MAERTRQEIEGSNNQGDERVVFEAIYESGSVGFVGSVDRGGTVTACGRNNIVIDGPRYDFIDSTGTRRPINEVLVKLADFEVIERALRDNDLSFNPDGIEKAVHKLS